MLSKFNFSYSTFDVYCKSQLWFYFMKLAKADETDPGMQVYGDAGTVVHKAMEDLINTGQNNFKKHWDDMKIDEQEGFKGRNLSFDKFKGMFDDLVKYYFSSIHKENDYKFVTELKIEREFLGMNFKAFIDLYVEHNGEIFIYDWKTNSTHDHQTHIKQRLFYSWLIWKIKGKIPSCHWVYASDMNIIEDRFTVEQMNKFEKEILQFMEDIKKKGMDIRNYEGGEWRNPFNKYYTLCKEEMERRQREEVLEIHLCIRGNFVFFEGDIDPKIEDGIDFRTRFDLKEKYWMQKEVKKKAKGRINLDDVGTVHLYNKKFRCFPIGLLDIVTKICKEFGEYYKKEVKIFLHDKRDANYLYRTTGIMPEKLNTNNEFRDYQKEAIRAFIDKKQGIINLPTGTGKTFVASEIIRRCDAKTLWIIDRKELLQQTRDVLKDLLGFEIGVIANGVVDIREVTIATVQSLNSKMEDLIHYLYQVNFVIVDEFHKSAAESYQKIFAKLPNTRWRLGLTATVMRDDGKEPILYSLLGEIVYKIDTQMMIDQGFLVRPKIKFYKIPNNYFLDDPYSVVYNNLIVDNADRNNKIVQLAIDNPGKKILILTKIVSHGKELCKMIPESEHIHGNTSGREKIMEDFRSGNLNVLVGTISIFAEGIDVPDLDIVINASANKGDVKSIQILGRVLRTFKNKDTATYIDFLDHGKYVSKHSKARMEIFKSQGHEVELI